MTPDEAFTASLAPDHRADSGWLYRGRELGRADDPLVFYVHPTTAPGPSWFADPADADVEASSRRVTDAQLHAFPGCSWAPRYRQATTRAFHEGNTDAYDLAYRDVAAAFTAFLADDAARTGPPRPIVLAGHSQGARHVQSLLREFFIDPALADRLVAAYVIGVPVPETGPGSLRWFPPATDPDMHGVVVAYSAVLAGTDVADVAAAAEPRVVVNPLTASAVTPDGEPAAHVLVDPPRTDLDVVRVSARGRDGVLEVRPVEEGALDAFALPDGNLHHVEVDLFSGNLRADVRRRTAQWRRWADSHSAATVSRRAESVPSWPGVQGRKVRIGNGWVHYVDLGPTDTEVVVLLHKLGGWAADWRHVAEMIAERHRVLVVDVPGHGGSVLEGDPPWAHPPRISARRIGALLDTLGVERFHVMGNSLGGIVGLLVTVADQSRVRSLTLVGVSLTERHSLARTLDIDRAVRQYFGPDWDPLPLRGAATGPATTDHPDVIDEQDSSRICAGRWVRPSERGVGLTGVEHLLPEVTVPVLVINGEHAGYRKYEDAARQLLSDVRIETVDDAGSFPHQERPSEVARLWEQFVSAAVPPG